ncbi:MAG: nuclear transport factor 2 family protein [Pseudomonadota bacterium]
MELQALAAALVEGCRTGQETQNIDRLYAPDAVSVEPVDHGEGREKQGRDAIKAKHAWWDGFVHNSAIETSDPYPHGDDRFAVHFKGSTTMRETGDAMPIDVIGVYHVAGGMIVREEFFYAM